MATLATTLAGLLLASCASTDLGQRAVGETVTDMATTEAMFDSESDKATKLIRRSAARIRDTDLESYVAALAVEAAGDFGGELDVYLLRVPAFNAYMQPNGTMGVFSGLLLRAETEDELALVLGHEFGHYYEKHILEIHAKVENALHAMNTVSIVTAPAGFAGDAVNTAISAAVIGDIYSFGRDQETEADIIGLERVSATGHDEGSAIRLWENLENEKQASSISKVRNRKSKLYDTHPTTPARIRALKAAANIVGDIPRASRQQRLEYRARIRPHLLDWLTDEIALRDAGATLNLLDRLDDLGEDRGVLLYARARVLDRALSHKRLKKDKLTRALMADISQSDVVDLLRQSSTYPDAPPAVHRDLGDRLSKLGQYEDAVAQLRRYLELEPGAKDAKLIESLIVNMETAS